jgi:hypothetical protein
VALGSERTALIKRGHTPLDRSTVDRWTGSTARSTADIIATSPLTSSPRHRLRHHVQPQPATCRRHSSPAGCLDSFAKRTPKFQNSQICPSTYVKAFQLGPFFMLRPLQSLVSIFFSLSLIFYMLDLLVSHLFMFRSLKSCRKPPKLPVLLQFSP